MRAAIAYDHPNTKRVTHHTLSFVRPVLERGDRVLDVGCGSGYVVAELAGDHPVMGVDIVDTRQTPLANFKLFNGLDLPCADGAYDVVLLNFVLHHVPNELKTKLLTEACRVARRRLFIFEDTPRTPIDWLAGWLHGYKFRREIGSTADFGYYTQRRWERVFEEHRLEVARSVAVPRFERLWWRPWATSYFVLDKRTPP